MPVLPAAGLVVLSWNVHVGGGAVDDVISRLQRGDFTGGHPVREFVLLLQEVFRGGDDVPAVVPRGFRPPSRIAPKRAGRAREDIRAIAAHHPMSLLYVPSMRNGGIIQPVEDRGNAILSTLPLGDPTAIELPIEHQRRVAIAATVRGRKPDGSAWTLRLVDVHLDTAVAMLHGGPFGARRRQAEALVAATEGSDMPTLAAGDFNTWGGSREPALDVMRSAFPASAPRDVEQRRPTFAGPLGFHAVLDHVFARGVPTVELRRLDDRFGSDHFPVIVELGF